MLMASRGRSSKKVTESPIVECTLVPFLPMRSSSLRHALPSSDAIFFSELPLLFTSCGKKVCLNTKRLKFWPEGVSRYDHRCNLATQEERARFSAAAFKII